MPYIQPQPDCCSMAFEKRATPLTTAIVVLLYFYLDKAPIQPQEPYLLYKDRTS